MKKKIVFEKRDIHNILCEAIDKVLSEDYSNYDFDKDDNYEDYGTDAFLDYCEKHGIDPHETDKEIYDKYIKDNLEYNDSDYYNNI